MSLLFAIGALVACVPSVFFNQFNGVSLLGLLLMVVTAASMIARNQTRR